MLLLGILAPLAVGSPPANDARAGALGVGLGRTIATSTWGATLEPGEPRACGTPGASVWYRIEPGMNGTLTLDTFGSQIDTILAVYASGSATPKGCNDDASEGVLQSRLSFRTRWDEAYDVQLAGFGGAEGDVLLRVGGMNRSDDRSQPDLVQAPSTTSRSTLHAGVEPGEAPPCGLVSGSLWFELVPPASGYVTLHTLDSDFPTVLAAYPDASLGSPLGCSASDVLGRSFLRLRVEAGVAILLQAAGHGGARGKLVLHVGEVEAEAVPNDARATPRSLVPGRVTVHAVQGATAATTDPVACGGQAAKATMWFKLAAPGTGIVALTTRETPYPVALAVYRDGLRLACSFSTDGLPYAHLHVETLGHEHEVMAVLPAGEARPLVVDVGPLEPCDGPANDCLSRATAVPSLPYSTVVSTTNATRETGEPSHGDSRVSLVEGDVLCSGDRPTVWFRWRSTLPRVVEADTLGSTASRSLAVFQGTTFGTMEEVACDLFNDSSTAPHQRVVFRAEAGVTYHFQIAVSPKEGARAAFNLRGL